MATLFTAFKGNGNSANKIVRSLDGDKLFLTNSYDGLRKDIDNINDIYDFYPKNKRCCVLAIF